MKKRPLTAEESKVCARLNSIYTDKKGPMGLTQEKLAQKMGFATQGAVGHYLRGVNAVGLEAGLKFAEALDVLPSQIDPEWSDYDVLHANGPEHGYARFDRHLKYLAQLSDSELETIELMLGGMAEMKNRKNS